MKLLLENWREFLNEKNPRIPRKKGQPTKSKKHLIYTLTKIRKELFMVLDTRMRQLLEQA